jgi:hypothetical protein
MVQPGSARIAYGIVLVAVIALLGCPNSVGVTCPNGQQYCNGQCLMVDTDAKNCGACGKPCPAGLGCFAGTCGCPAGLATCTEMCVNTQQDNLNCGACGQACPAGNVCSGGTCKPGCTANLLLCGNICVDPQSDGKNCGTCGHGCDPGNYCVGGNCVLACAPPLLVCMPDGGTSPGGICVDKNVDRNNCGGCGNACPLIEGSGRQLDCCGSCVDLNTDRQNCGTCGHKCMPTDFCSSGNCLAG